MNTKIFLVRHGETGWTQMDRYAGRTDIPLSPKGIEQVKLLADYLRGERIDICYSSPLNRCMNTAKILAASHSVDIRAREELVEIDFGAWDGLLREEIEAHYPAAWKAWLEDPAAVPPTNGETGYQLAARVIPVFFEIAHVWAGKTVLLVTHKTVNRIIIAHALGVPIREYRRMIQQATSGLNILYVKDYHIRIELLNGLFHLL